MMPALISSSLNLLISGKIFRAGKNPSFRLLAGLYNHHHSHRPVLCFHWGKFNLRLTYRSLVNRMALSQIDIPLKGFSAL